MEIILPQTTSNIYLEKNRKKRAKGMVEYNMSTSKTIGKGKKRKNANELLCMPC